MAVLDLLFRMRRQASIVAFNDVLPANFKLIHKPDTEWISVSGVDIDEIVNLALVPHDPGPPEVDATLSSDLHANIRISSHYAGWDGLFILPGDPDYDDPDADPPIVGEPKLDNSKLKRWFKNNGGERLDDASEHPRSGRADMRWWRWEEAGPPLEWVDVTIDEPAFRRRVWM